MIQRKQTLWLLLAALSGFAYTQTPIYSATLADGAAKNYMVQENLLLFAVSIATALLAAAIVFLFKNRPLQLKLSSLGLLLSVALIALEVYLIEQFKTANQLSKATYAWGSLVPIVALQ